MPRHREGAKRSASEKKSHDPQRGKSAYSVLKEIVFIRHGHSLGQAAGRERRRVDMSLRDADLSPSGISQVHHLKKQFFEWDVSPELVMSSPLTRALKTALTVFPEHHPVMLHPGLAELNSHRPIPENRGRELKELLVDDGLVELGFAASTRVNLDILASSTWPEPGDEDFDIREFLKSRPERKIAIVSHFNYIKSCLRGVLHGGVDNCSPIHALLVEKDDVVEFVLCDSPHAWCSRPSAAVQSQSALLDFDLTD